MTKNTDTPMSRTATGVCSTPAASGPASVITW